MGQRFRTGTKKRYPRQGFQQLCEYVPRNEDIEGGDVFDIRAKTRSTPPPDTVMNDHFTHLRAAQRGEENFRMLAARETIGNLLAKGKGTGDIMHALVNPGAIAAPATSVPNLVLQTPQAGWVGDIVAPPFQWDRSTGLYLEWTPATTHRLYDNRIVKGEEPKEIEMDAVEHSFTLHEYALANRLYKRDLQNVHTNLRVQGQAADALNNAMHLSREGRVLNVALSALVPGGAAAGGAWNLLAGTPITDVINAIVAIFVATQEVPTHIVIPFLRAVPMTNTTEWIARFAGLNVNYGTPLFQVATGLQNLGLQVVFSKVCVLTTEQNTASDPNLFANIMGNQSLVFKQDPAPTQRSRCFMYAPYTIRDEVRSGEWDREVKTRSMYWQQYEETTELLVDAFSGRRITGI